MTQGGVHARLSGGGQATRSTRNRAVPPAASGAVTGVGGGRRILDHWSKPIVARAGSVLARMFRYSAARADTRRH
jgi:hypothetical protein